MTLYNLVEHNEGDSLGIFESKLNEKQINKMERFCQIIYHSTSDWAKTEVLENMVKNGSMDMFEEEFEDIDIDDIKNILKNSEVILMKWYEGKNKKRFRMTKGYRIKSPFKDKSFKWIKVKEVSF